MARTRKTTRSTRRAATPGKKRVSKRSAKGVEKKETTRKNPVWDDARRKKLAELYPNASWEDLLKAFPGQSMNSIQRAARRAGISRPHPNTLRGRPDTNQAIKKEPVTEDKVAAFMTCGRSVDEIAKKFSLTRDEAQQWVNGGLKEYDLFVGPNNLRGEQTYVAVPKVDTTRVSDRSWTFMRQMDGQPYGVIQFPADYIHRKIKIVPLDSILFGDPDHDAERFERIVSKIARSPNTFCFLNGDIIAQVTSGKKDVREQILLERCAEFQRQLRSIAHKVLWAQQGCLEARSLRQQRFDPLQFFCERFNIPYFEEPVYIDLMWHGNIFTFWAMHGHSTAQVKGSKINALRRPAQHHEFTHFIVMGHVNDSMWNRVPKLVREPATCTIEAREEFHIILPSFKRYFGSREAKRGYQPASNNDIVLYIYPDGEHHVKTMSGGGWK